MNTFKDVVLRLKSRYIESASVYTTSAFLRMQLGESLTARGLAPHIAWTREEAMRHVQEA